MSGISFEFFPPRSNEASDVLQETVDILAAFQPAFQSVTFGASGSQRNGTLETAISLQSRTGIPAASHLTYTGSEVKDVQEFADQLWDAGVKRLVALRGDNRKDGSVQNPFADTPEFVSALKSCHPFEIAVACYPEVHPKAKSREADIAVLKAKQDAGATSAITQFFFDNSLFYEFVEEVREAGITIPLVPGILPIHNFEKVKTMAKECGTSIPDHVEEAFSEARILGTNETEIAAELLKAQVHDLACAGFESIHIYTLNRAPLASIAAGAFLAAHESKLNVEEEKKVA
ncbi:MAG: methylenetetrahydrofolate reductase [Pseudomonadota bacterium]